MLMTSKTSLQNVKALFYLLEPIHLVDKSIKINLTVYPSIYHCTFKEEAVNYCYYCNK